MILGDPADAAVQRSQGSRVTIDEIFSHVARLRPVATALVDAPNRGAFTDGAPRRLSYAEADRIVSAIAGRLRRMGLPTGSVVGIQLPNITEYILTILGIMRAGLIAAPLPLLWRRADSVAALARIGGKALITCRRVGNFDHGQHALHVALDVFSIRYLCGFGDNMPDGFVSFDDLFAAESRDSLPSLNREAEGNPAAHVAAVTFDANTDGIVPVARSHLELLAGGLGVLLESRVAPGATILSTLAPSSFAGICLTLLPWLMSGGTLVLHHAFDAPILERQLNDERCHVLALPGPVALRLAATGVFAGKSVACLIAPWHSPELLPGSPHWHERDIGMVDVTVLGEMGLLAARRDASGKPTALSLGPIAAPRGSADSIIVAELVRTDSGTVALRGAMAPRGPFPPGDERSGQPHLKIGHNGLIDSGYTCHLESETKTIVVTGPPRGVVNIGGYRFPLRGLQDAIGRIDEGATLAAYPDPLVGRRLIGTAIDRGALKAALEAAGINPLVIAAFGDQSQTGTPVAA